MARASGASTPQHARLRWYDCHFVDLWAQSGLPERTELGRQAFCLPWSDRASMGDVLQSLGLIKQVDVNKWADNSYAEAATK